jgi:hypothetical protein
VLDPVRQIADDRVEAGTARTPSSRHPPGSVALGQHERPAVVARADVEGVTPARLLWSSAQLIAARGRTRTKAAVVSTLRR